ncbi:MAG: ABC transporter permease [Verrucomicrobiota bacterium]
MQRILAIVWLSWKAAFRYRLIWVLSALLLGAVIGLPLLLKDDETARGFIQIVLTYTLGSITALLGIATLWLACGTLARDIEDCQMQVVAVKPIARWEIWLGKWLGLVSLNAFLLALAGVCVYGLIYWRAGSLPADQQAILKNEVLVARGSLKSPPINLRPMVDQLFAARLKETPIAPADQPFVRQQIEEQVKARHQLVMPGYIRTWKLDAREVRKSPDQPLYLRIKFYSSQAAPNATFAAMWRFGKLDAPARHTHEIKSMAAETFHEFSVPSNAISDDGSLVISLANINQTALLFPLEDGLEVLYHEGGFALNFARGLGIILCWLSLLAAVGLAAASFLSFPVAAFASAALLAMMLGSSNIASSVEEGTVGGKDHETGQPMHPVVDRLMLPVFKVVLTVINLAQSFAPVDLLSNGRSISWTTLSLAVSQIVLLLGGLFGLFGAIVFTRRELATAQGTS